MKSTLELDPSYPYQVSGELLAFWRPRGRGRDALAEGLVATVSLCTAQECQCTVVHLNAWLVDDRATQVTREGSQVATGWSMRGDPRPRPTGSAQIELDMATGAARLRGGGALPEGLRGYFIEPVPYWVLDHLWALWCAHRPILRGDWRAETLKHWTPEALLSTMLSFPEERVDRYVIEGELFQVDPMFCVKPSCDCTNMGFSVFKFDEERNALEEMGAFFYSIERGVITKYVEGEWKPAQFRQIFLDWRARHAPLDERLAELQARVRQRGLEFMEEQGSQTLQRLLDYKPSPPVKAAKHPGRNAPCPCDSGKKYKKCCGKNV